MFNIMGRLYIALEVSKYRTRCGSRMFLENDVVHVLDFTEGNVT
jgi:hypothetical protein